MRDGKGGGKGGDMDKYCNDFMRHGRCERGTDCRFLHLTPDEVSRGRVQQICFDFLNKGECRWAKKCRYLHVTKDDPLAMSDGLKNGAVQRSEFTAARIWKAHKEGFGKLQPVQPVSTTLHDQPSEARARVAKRMAALPSCLVAPKAARVAGPEMQLAPAAEAASSAAETGGASSGAAVATSALLGLGDYGSSSSSDDDEPEGEQRVEDEGRRAGGGAQEDGSRVDEAPSVVCGGGSSSASSGPNAEAGALPAPVMVVVRADPSARGGGASSVVMPRPRRTGVS